MRRTDTPALRASSAWRAQRCSCAMASTRSTAGGISRMGEHREQIHRRLRLMGTQVIRVFVFDQPVPDPFKEWHLFAGTVQAVLDVGAKPMVTFAKFPPPYDNPRNIRNFVARCSEVVWGCIEQWGGETVKDWYWCIWNEPNNPDRRRRPHASSSTAASMRRWPRRSCRSWTRISAAARP